ncbi:MAG: hypothetical protein QW734_08195 [Candidatus Bathyarchaeia archaeon]
MEERPKRIYIPENPDICFEYDSKSREAVMYVCNEPFVRKAVPMFNERTIRKLFRKEIEDHKDVVCEVVMEPKEGEG